MGLVFVEATIATDTLWKRAAMKFLSGRVEYDERSLKCLKADVLATEGRRGGDDDLWRLMAQGPIVAKEHQNNVINAMRRCYV